MRTDCDVAVVGAGHNALIAACYLAAAGLDVEVLERDTVAGGAVSTVERFPGHRVDRGASLHVMIRHTPIVEELALGGCGLRYLDADPWGYVPATHGGGAGITFETDLAATCASIAAACGDRDAEAYRTLIGDLATPTRHLMAAFAGPPGPLRLAARGAVMVRTRAGREMARWFLQPAEHLIEARFAGERMRATLAWLASQSGPAPHETATVGQLCWVALMHQLPPGRPVGGSGMLTAALVERLRRSGGHLQLGDPAVALTLAGGRVTGVHTAAGRAVRARAVLSGAHIGATLDLLAAAGAEPAGARARIRVGHGIGAVVRLSTNALPRYPGAEPAALYGMQLLVSDRDRLRSAYADYLAGRPPARPAVLAMTPTAQDPSLAPPGRHLVTLWAQWYRHGLAGGRPWTDLREEVADAAIAAVEEHAPGFADSVRARYIQTPADLADELALPRGNVMHVEMAPEAMFGLRPLPRWSGYRTPIPGLYLTGASTHPGGGVFGASGRNAASRLLADLRRRRGRP